MVTISDIRNKVLSHMAEMDLSDMSMMDISAYVDVLRRVSDITEKPYMETLMDAMKQGFNSCSTEKSKPMEGLALGLAAGGGLGV